MQCFVHFDLKMCFSPQRHAIFQHLNFKKCSEPDMFCTYSADAAVTMLFAAVGVQLLGSETAEMKLRTVLLPCELGIGVT